VPFMLFLSCCFSSQRAGYLPHWVIPFSFADKRNILFVSSFSYGFFIYFLFFMKVQSVKRWDFVTLFFVLLCSTPFEFLLGLSFNLEFFLRLVCCNCFPFTCLCWIMVL
jgi:hypothetical protein